MRKILLEIDLAICSLWTIAALGSRIAWVATPATWIVMLLIMSRLLLSFTLYHREKKSWIQELLLTIPDWKGRLRADATKLGIIAHRVPLAYLILGDLYYEPDDNGKSNMQLAVEYYMKAEEHAVLDRHGAERVLDYYRNGGNVQLTEDDVKRLELIVQPKDVETE